MSVDVLILCFNRPDEIVSAIKSCEPYKFGSTIVLDNGSQPAINIQVGEVHRSDLNLGVCGGRNHLAAISDADLLLFLDDDAVIEPNVDFEALIEKFQEDPKLAVIAGLAVRGSGEIAKFEFPARRVAQISKSREVGYFIGGFCIMRRLAYVELGGYDPSFFYGHEETDFSLRVAGRGLKICFDPSLRFVHSPSVHGRTPTANAFIRLFTNRMKMARVNLPWIARFPHIFIWFSYYLFKILKTQPKNFFKIFQVFWVKNEKEQIAKANRIRVRDLIKLQKIGYRIFW